MGIIKLISVVCDLLIPSTSTVLLTRPLSNLPCVADFNKLEHVQSLYIELCRVNNSVGRLALVKSKNWA